MMTNTITPTSRPVLLMAGGTGGHVFPALAIADALRTQGFSLCWLGTQRGLEARIVPAAGINIHYINITGLRGKGILAMLTFPFKISLALWQSVRILRDCRPIAVIGMGGFVTGPGGIAAWLMRIPLLIHEQNAVAGLTNRWLGRLANHVIEAFPGTFSSRYQALYIGNPLRTTIMALPPQRTIHFPLRILVLGGSLGAKALNEIVPAALLQVQNTIEVWHQTGEMHFETTRQTYGHAPFQIQLKAFIEDMAAAYAWADLVICRAGALTVSELAQVGIASILIPYPHAVDDHQTHNAQFLADQGAAILLPQKQLTATKLATLINELINHPVQLQTMARAARTCATPTALQQMVDLITKTIADNSKARQINSSMTNAH